MEKQLRITRRWMAFCIVGLFLSGLTAMPLESELEFLTKCVPYDTNLGTWLRRVYLALVDTNEKYPFLAYGYDWLAFANFLFAILFIGAYRDPVRNKWIVQFGMIACLLIIPFAFIAGYVRGIPLGWRLIDCSFGIIGLFPLGICLARIIAMERAQRQEEVSSIAGL
jgi:hypothetical protein